jgi:RimJ/RimL family protein N-acetyltransferase
MIIGQYAKLRVLDSGDAEYVRLLRNSPEVYIQFQSREFINDIAQETFIKSLSVSSPHRYFIAEDIQTSTRKGVYFVRNLDHRNQRGENGLFLDAREDVDGVLAFEAAYLLLKYEFDYLNLNKICAEVLASNRRAIRFNESLGMLREGLRSRHVYLDGDFQDVVQFALFREDFELRPSPFMRSFQQKFQG